jgi:hypothetical protein
MALGHPIPAFTICCVSTFLLYQWAALQTTEAGMVGVGAAACASWALKANERRKKYLNWQRQWAAMGRTSPAPVRRGTVLKGLTIGTILTVLLVVALQSDHADIAIVGTTLGLMLLTAFAGMLIVVGKLLGRLRRKRRTKPRLAVRVVITRPVLAVPRLDQAYAALPPHCQRLLRGRRIGA